MHAWYEKEAAHEEAKRVVRALSRELAVVRAELKESRAHAAQVRQDRGHNRQRLHVVEDRAERLESKLRVAIADRDAQLQKRKHAEARAKALAGLAQPQVSPEVVEKIEKDARRLIDGEYVSVASIISHAAISLHSVACAAHRMTTLENEVQMWNSMPCLWGNGRYCLSSGGQANVIALSHAG